MKLNQLQSASMIILLFSLIVLAGCAGSKVGVIAPATHYPVSASPTIYSADGEILSCYFDLKVVGKFSKKYHRHSILWSGIGFSKSKRDISKDFDEEIRRQHGQAIVNLKATTSLNGLTGFYAWFPFFSILNCIIPSTSELTVEGDIVVPLDDTIQIYNRPFESQTY